MPQGLIVKALSGYYYVLPEGNSLSESTLIQCRARGVFRNNGISPLVGDQVVFELTENEEGTVIEILPRSSELVRPPIANVDLAVLVFSVKEPALNLQLLDKFLVHTENSGLDSLICFTKVDLLNRGARIKSLSTSGGEQDGEEVDNNTHGVPELQSIVRLYESIGYQVIVTSAKFKEGIPSIMKRLSGAISVFAGQSGVGKSSLLNAMISGLELETNSISHKLGRGKHTTRHVELIPLQLGGFVADTPGFSQLDFVEIEVEQLGGCFREFASFAEKCRFRGCLHMQEPGCKVKEAKDQGEIAAFRYDHYVQFFLEMKDRKRRY